MPSLLNIGVSGLTAHQSALAAVGNNITNANVEGYSRQEAIFSSRESQNIGGGFVGGGVSISSVRRIYDAFTAQQVITDTSRFEALQVLSQGLGAIDNVLASESAGLSGVLDDLFAAVQSASESPASLPLRQQVISEADRFVARYQDINRVIEDTYAQIDENVETLVGEVNQIAQGIAELNLSISESRLQNGDAPNDLLDARDQLLRDLAEKVDFNTAIQDGDFVNVYIGSGQALVLGSDASELAVLDASQGGGLLEVGILIAGGQSQTVTDGLHGGQLGGELRLREQGLGDIANQLGLLATLAVSSFNTVHRQGLDLNQLPGGDFFTPIDDREAELARVQYFSDNSSPNAVASVQIDDVRQLQSSEYNLTFEGASVISYQVTRSGDGAVVATGAFSGNPPLQITTSDGFSVSLEQGSFADGDQLLLSPARLPPENIEVQVTSAASLALALPISLEASTSNSGTGNVLQPSSAEVSNLLQSLADGGATLSSEPLLVRFTSPTTFDILNNSDPNNPVQFSPPLTNMPFSPGQTNTILEANTPVGFIDSSASFSSGATPVAIGAGANSSPGETLTLTQTVGTSGAQQTVSIAIPAGSSAEQVAAQLNTYGGLQASARNEAVLSLNGDTTQTRISLNGIDLTAVPVPASVDTDFLATRINTLFAGSGISADSDGSNLTITSSTGQDLVLQNTGGTGQDFSLSSINGQTQVPAVTVDNVTDNPGQNEVYLSGTVSLVSTRIQNLSSDGGYFISNVESQSDVVVGFDIAIGGVPQAGDEFTVDFDYSGSGDNRNALALAQLQSADLLSNGGGSLGDIYASLVGSVGVATASAKIDAEASSSLLARSTAQLQSESGVNLDEEAAKLLQYEQAYNASAQVISVARTIFDSLLAAFR